MGPAPNTCPLWGTTARTTNTNRDGYLVDSPRAGGQYEITRSAYVNQRNTGENQRLRLTSWLVEQRMAGVDCPVITTKILEFAESRKPLSVHERADRLLQWLTTLSPYIGALARVLDGDNAQAIFAYSESIEGEEVRFLAKYLVSCGWLDSYSVHSGGFDVTISVRGYAHLAELDTKHVNSSQAFVAMWFDDSMTEAYDNGLAEGIKKAGYKPLRIDRKDHNNKIDDELIAEIRRSKFLVADFTQGEDGARGSVYYEAGFAHGLGIPVIFTYKKGSEPTNHFDTRQYNHIEWESPEDLARKLQNRISATLGDGPDK
jgi:nucleoside 2-deoxyribosyltransferase